MQKTISMKSLSKYLVLKTILN